MTYQLTTCATLRRIEAAHAHQALMEQAGQAAADLAMRLQPDKTRPVVILAGPGNNGGDAFVVARHLHTQGYRVYLVFSSDPETLPTDAAQAWKKLRSTGLGWKKSLADLPASIRWGLIIDGLFGIGLTRAPEGIYAQWIAQANAWQQHDNCPLLALDCPSGLNADTGCRPGTCISATHTITFIRGKPGLWTADGPDYCGEIHLATLGIGEDSETPFDGRRLTTADFAERLKPRRRNSHKGSFGGVGILGGARSMTGAALLAGRAALKLGAGRVYLGFLDPDGPNVDLQQPELMIRRIDTLFQADLQALVCGPGLGKSSEAAQFVEQALKCPLPLVLDADALNILAVDGRLEGNLYNRVAPAILTPHPAEAGRLLGCSIREIQQDRVHAACEMAQRFACPVALKGCGTIIATADGRWWINTTGNPGMATAGMGDVLSGLTGTLLSQNWPADQALLAAVHLHGAAADALVSQGTGPVGLTAGEVIDAARAVYNQWISRKSLEPFHPGCHSETSSGTYPT